MWSKNYKRCTICKTTEISHGAFGRCEYCYYRYKKELKKILSAKEDTNHSLDWEGKKIIKRLYRDGVDTEILQEKYKNFYSLLELEDLVWREKGGCDTAL